MKHKTLKIALLALGSLLLVSPNMSAAAPSRSLVIHNSVDPTFPLSQRDQQRRGSVHLVINVDSEGKLVDYLIVGYSRKAFAQSLEDVLSKWTFEPALLEGNPVSVVSELSVEFEAGGIVVNTNFTDIVDNFLFPNRRNEDEYQLATLRQIDRIPEPIQIVAPVYGASLKAAGIHGAVSISFFIDEEGKVRLPYVNKADHMVLADLAMAALRQWRFSPPTVKGKHVLVKVTQVFTFQGGTAPSEPTSSGTK